VLERGVSHVLAGKQTVDQVVDMLVALLRAAFTIAVSVESDGDCGESRSDHAPLIPRSPGHISLERGEGCGIVAAKAG
jgi:hypothetical protein